MKKYIHYILFFAFASVVINACKNKEEDPVPPENPYSKVDYGDTTKSTTDVDPNTIVGLHKNIFSVKCANPACHDGTFEPDFRTIQSSYNSLVWNSVIKNTTDSAFHFRVVPYNYQMSWLHERVTTNDVTLGRMPLYSSALSTAEIGNIKTWISNGAKDMFGNSPQYPNSEPTFQAFIATNTTFTARYDTNRVGGVYYNSFILPTASTVYIVIFVKDDSTAISNLTNNKIKMSLTENNFTAPFATVTGNFVQSGTTPLWIFSLNTASLPQGQQIYFRHYCNDNDHVADTQFPTSNLQHEYQTYFSFTVQ